MHGREDLETAISGEAMEADDVWRYKVVRARSCI
jgi:hypothetical protein